MKAPLAILALLLALTAVTHATDAPVRLETVHYDYLDEDGNLAGGHVQLGVAVPLQPTRRLAAETRSARHGDAANRIDLVILGDGYTASEDRSYALHAAFATSTLFDWEPFASYESFFNVHRITVISNESGVDNDPTEGIERDTALGMGFWCNGIERLLCVDVGSALGYAANAPDADFILAIANATKYGGAGYTSLGIATVAGGNSSAADVAVHEFGHSIGRLADEYDYGGPLEYTGGEPSRPNVSTYTADEMLANGQKWSAWLGENEGQFDGLVDTFEGAFYSELGVYRPTFNSKMRSLNRPFNLPSIEALIFEFYQFVDLIDDGTPAGALLTPAEDVWIATVEPTGHALEINWLLDGVVVPGFAADTVAVAEILAAADAGIGTYTLTAKVTDPTQFVRSEIKRSQLMTAERTWTVTVDGLVGDLNCDGSVDFFDIDPFVTALLYGSGYPAAFPDCDRGLADVNGDGAISFFDIDPFVALLTGDA